MIKSKQLLATIGSFPEVDIEFCLERMLMAVPIMGMRAVGSGFLRNPDQAYVILAESHMFLHVLDRGKKRMAFFDIFTCGEGEPGKGYDYLKREIGFSEDKYGIHERG